MIWFKIKKLENKIINNQLSDKDCFIYLILSIVFSIIILCLIKNKASDFHVLLFFKCIFYTAIAIWGLFLVFKTNENGDGVDFFKRYIALKFVIIIRLVLLGIVLVFLFSIISIMIIGVGGFIEFSNTETHAWIIFIAGVILNLTFYLMLNNSFKRLRNNKKRPLSGKI